MSTYLLPCCMAVAVLEARPSREGSRSTTMACGISKAGDDRSHGVDSDGHDGVRSTVFLHLQCSLQITVWGDGEAAFASHSLGRKKRMANARSGEWSQNRRRVTTRPQAGTTSEDSTHSARSNQAKHTALYFGGVGGKPGPVRRLASPRVQSSQSQS